MVSQCTPNQLEFPGLARRRVVGDFDGGEIVSDAGALLLREVEQGTRLVHDFARCFTDYRAPNRVEHSVKELLAQRVYGIALGYEDLNDHDTLRSDALLATLVGKADPRGQDRKKERDRGSALAGKSTLNRLELSAESPAEAEKYKKISYDGSAIDRFFVEKFLDSYDEPPTEIILDVDATDDPLHGKQEGRFFHGYYGHYCYLPLYMFCGSHLLLARLRPSNIDASLGTEEELAWIVPMIRHRWPHVIIIVRGDSGFARESIMAWCEANDVHFIFGLAKNARLTRQIRRQLERVRRKHSATGRASRCYSNLSYRTQKTWSRKRRVVAKAEHLDKGSNPRFVVTSFDRKTVPCHILYEKLYCARGDMENRIKEQKCFVFADRTSANSMRANQLRLYLSSLAYVLMDELQKDYRFGQDYVPTEILPPAERATFMGIRRP